MVRTAIFRPICGLVWLIGISRPAFAAGQQPIASLAWRERNPAGDGPRNPAGSVRVWTLLAAFAVSLLVLPGRGHAVPSYTRQTGQPCTSCHMTYVELTPFGRAFKLGGYTLSTGDRTFPPLSAVVQTSFTHTEAPQPGGAAPNFGPNDNFALQIASVYVAGKIFDNVGAFSQWTYDGIGRSFGLDHNDWRYANSASIGGNDLAYGVTLNDAPTVEDIYNTTTAFAFPFVSSPLAPMPAARTLIDSLPFEVGGAGAYAMLNSTVYGAFTLYKTFPRDFQRAMGVRTSGEAEIDTVAPYWRFALQRDWDQHSLSAGTFGMYANTFPGRMHGAGTDRFLDIGLDAQYQFNGDPHAAWLDATWTHEDQRLSASQALGFSANSSNTLNFFKVTGSYLYQHTYGVDVSFFETFGSADPGLYMPAPMTGSANGKPNSSGWIFELDWLPFMHSPLEFAPWAQTKLSLQYVAYNKFNGGSQNYDGFGRNASGNNTLFLHAWFAF